MYKLIIFKELNDEYQNEKTKLFNDLNNTEKNIQVILNIFRKQK